MWKVGDVEPVRIVGAEGEPYRFNVNTEDEASPLFLLPMHPEPLPRRRQHIWNRLC